MSFDIPVGEFVQFIHVDASHWITISNINTKNKNTICVYDSLQQKPSTNTIKILTNYFHTPEKIIEIKTMNVDRQPNAHDCGLYAIAFGTSILFGETPTNLKYDRRSLRHHFGKCVDNGIISPFPSGVKYRQPEVLHAYEAEVYCQCRCPDDGNSMTQCQKCKEWYHATCMKLNSSKPIKKWKCELCH